MAVTEFFQSLEQWREQTKRDPKHDFRIEHKRKYPRPKPPSLPINKADATIIFLALKVATQHGSQHLRSRYQQLADDVEAMLNSADGTTSTCVKVPELA